MAEEDIYGKILFLVERQRFTEAEKILSSGFAENPHDPQLMYLSAVVDYSLDHDAVAEETLNGLLRQEPDHFPGRYLLSNLYLHQDRLVEAEEAIIGLLKDYPESAECYTVYACIMLHALQLEKCEKLIREALRLDPENLEALTLSVIYRVIRYDQSGAGAKLAELMRHYPQSQETAWALISVLATKGHEKELLRLAREMLRSDPANEDLVELVCTMRARTHPTMILMWPMQKWGWYGAAGMWIGFIVVLSVAKKILPQTGVVALCAVWFAYLVYSWCYPPLLKRLLR